MCQNLRFLFAVTNNLSDKSGIVSFTAIETVINLIMFISIVILFTSIATLVLKSRV